MKKTINIFGTNQNTKMQNYILQGYACVWIFRENRVILNGPDGRRLENVTATTDTLEGWNSRYELIDVKVLAKKKELLDVQKKYQEIKELQDQIDAENKKIPPNKEIINGLKTKIETLNWQIGIEFPWVFNQFRWIGDKFICVPKIAVEAVGGFAVGILDSVGGWALVSWVQNKAREYYLKATATGDLLMTANAGGVENKGFSLDEFVDKLAEGEKVKAMKQIILHAQKQTPPIRVDYQGGNYQFSQDGKIVKLGKIDCIKDQKIMIAAYGEHLIENPNFDWLESKQALIDLLKDTNGVISKDTELEAVRKKLKDTIEKITKNQIETINQAIQWLPQTDSLEIFWETKLVSEWETLKTKIEKWEVLLTSIQLEETGKKIKAEENALKELLTNEQTILQNIASLESQIASAWPKGLEEKNQQYESARHQASEDILHILRQELVKEQLGKWIRDYKAIDDMILTRIWKGSVNFLNWIAGIKDKVEIIPKQINSIDELTTFVVEVRPLPSENPDGKDHSFENLLPTFTKFLGDEFKLDQTSKTSIEDKLRKARSAYLEKVNFKADTGNLSATLTTERSNLITKQEEIAKKKTEIAKLQAKYGAFEKEDIENSAVFNLINSPLGKWIMECNLNDQTNHALWKKTLYNVSDYQEGISQTINKRNNSVTDALKYKPSLSENIISAIDDLPPLAKLGGVVIALLMMKNSPGFGKVLGGLAMAGIAGEVITKVATDGDKGIIDFLAEKGKGLTGDTKDMIAKIHSVEARNAILKFLENSPQENAKPAIVLTQIMGDNIGDFLGESGNLVVNGSILTTTETYYQAVRSRGNRAGDMGRFFDKHGIKKEDFDKAIQIMFAEAAPDGTVQKSIEGYKYIQEKVKTNPSWKHFTVIDVIANSLQTHLLDANLNNQEKEMLEQNKREKIQAILTDLGLNWAKVERWTDGKWVATYIDSPLVLEGGWGEENPKDLKLKFNETEHTVSSQDGKWSVEFIDNFKEKILNQKFKEMQTLLPDGAQRANFDFDGEYFVFGKKEAGKQTRFKLSDGKLTDVEINVPNDLQWSQWVKLEAIQSLKWEQKIDSESISWLANGTIVFSTNLLENANLEMVDLSEQKIQGVLGLNSTEHEFYKKAGYDIKEEKGLVTIDYKGNSLKVQNRMITLAGETLQKQYNIDSTPFKILALMDQIKSVKAHSGSGFDDTLWGSKLEFQTDGYNPEMDFTGEDHNLIDNIGKNLNIWFYGGKNEIEYKGRYANLKEFYKDNKSDLQQLISTLKDSTILSLNAENNRSAFYLDNGKIMFARTSAYNASLVPWGIWTLMTMGDLPVEIENNKFNFRNTKQGEENYYLMLALNKAWLENR